MLLVLKSEHYLRKSTDLHHMRNMCQIILRSSFIHFLGRVSTDHFSQFIPITKCSPYSLPHLLPISSAPWYLPYVYHYCYRLFFHRHKEEHSHSQKGFFSSTEIPHVRHEQGGIGIKCQHDCSTRSGREMKRLWHNFYPFYQHNHQSWFSVQKYSPPLLQISRGKLWLRMAHRKWSLEDVRRIRLSVWTIRPSATY